MRLCKQKINVTLVSFIESMPFSISFGLISWFKKQNKKNQPLTKGTTYIIRKYLILYEHYSCNKLYQQEITKSTIK